MARLPSLKPRVVIKALLKAGFYIHHQKGSHVQMRHRVKHHLRLTIPSHSGFDLPPYVVLSIIRQAGMNRDDFLDLL